MGRYEEPYDPDEDEEEEQERDPEKKELSPREMMEERLLKTRTILIYGGIDQKMAMSVTQQLLLLSSLSDDPIKIFINSQGGHVESGDTIFDMIRFVKPAVKIIGTGWVASAGALIYSAAERMNRFSLPNTRYLLHQPLGGIQGPAQDLAIEAQEIIKMKRRLNEIFARQTGQSIEKIEHDTDRNFWMTAEQAREYGLVGKVIESMDEV